MNHLSKQYEQQTGFTLIEVVVSLFVLTLGAATVWYTFQTSARLDVFNRTHQEALSFAQSEGEYLRILPKELVTDTCYIVSGSFERKYLVTRTVFDSARIEATLEQIDVDQHMRPLYLRRPLEVKIEVREVKDEFYSFLDTEKRPLATVSLLKPDYQWY